MHDELVMAHTKAIKANGLTFDCRIEGNHENELVIFLHGWPETSFMWVNLMTHLSKRGFLCVAPDLRGYSKGACPEGIEEYSLHKLSEDVIQIFEHFKKHGFHLVGHDWGALIGWQLVHDYKNKILSWTGISVPHPQAFGKALVEDKVQIQMSRYVESFQIPEIPEANLRQKNYERLRNLWAHCDQATVGAYLKVFSNPEQLTATLNYYRCNYALLKQASILRVWGAVQVPTLFIWGNKDIAVGAYAVQEHHQYMEGAYIFLELDAGHWLVHTHYKELETAITSHICRN